jgi:hypothetical protein
MKWELFLDDSYYGLWCVRPAGDTDFNSQRTFHFIEKTDAGNFKNLVSKAVVSERGRMASAGLDDKIGGSTICGNACDYYGMPGVTYCTNKCRKVEDSECEKCDRKKP